MKKSLQRAFIEVAFIVFLFYANLLMGAFTRSGEGRTRGLSWALANLVTLPNLTIGVLAALVGYVVVEFLRRRS